MSYRLNWERQDSVLIGVLEGPVDGSSAEALLNALASGIEPTDRILLLDVEKVSFICGVALGVVLLTAGRFSVPDKVFGVCTPSGPIRNTFAASGFDQMVTVYESRSQAIDKLTRQMT